MQAKIPYGTKNNGTISQNERSKITNIAALANNGLINASSVRMNMTGNKMISSPTSQHTERMNVCRMARSRLIPDSSGPKVVPDTQWKYKAPTNHPIIVNMKTMTIRIGTDEICTTLCSPSGVSTGIVCASKLEIPMGNIRNLLIKLNKLKSCNISNRLVWVSRNLSNSETSTPRRACRNIYLTNGRSNPSTLKRGPSQRKMSSARGSMISQTWLATASKPALSEPITPGGGGSDSSFCASITS